MAPPPLVVDFGTVFPATMRSPCEAQLLTVARHEHRTVVSALISTAVTRR